MFQIFVQLLMYYLLIKMMTKWSIVSFFFEFQILLEYYKNVQSMSS